MDKHTVGAPEHVHATLQTMAPPTAAKSAPQKSPQKASGPRLWNPWLGVVYAVVTYFVAQFAAVLILSGYTHLHQWPHDYAVNWLNNSLYAQFFFVLLAEGIMFGAVWQFMRLRGLKLRVIGWRKPSWWDPVMALSGFAAYFVLYLVLITLATHIFHSVNVNQKQELGFDNVTGDKDLFITFLSLVILPPLVEETVFRGFILTGLMKRYKWWIAALITSVIFGVAHLELGSGQPALWSAAIDTFTLSMVLCYLRKSTDSLWPGIWLHALKNGVAFATLYIFHSF